MSPSLIYDQEDLLPLSALADLCFCERRAALHTIERIWDDNVATVEGSFLHKRVDRNLSSEWQGSVFLSRGLRLRSLRLGLVGRADLIEFHPLVTDFQSSFPSMVFDGPRNSKKIVGSWQPFPVEFKRGKLRHEKGFEVQLCAQAICLEEMLEVKVPSGAIFFGKTARRLEVAFDHDLREQTERSSIRLHEIVRSQRTPRFMVPKKMSGVFASLGVFTENNRNGQERQFISGKGT